MRLIFIITILLFNTALCQAAEIVSSKVIVDDMQADKRRYIQERHFFKDGTYEDVFYLAEAKANAQSILSIHAAVIEERIATPKIPEDPAYYLSQIERSFKAVLGDTSLKTFTDELKK